MNSHGVHPFPKLGKLNPGLRNATHVRQADIDRSFGALLKQLPNKSEIEALLIEVNQAGLGRGLQFELFRPGPEEIKDFYAELPVTVKINGSYHDIGAFAADIAKCWRKKSNSIRQCRGPVSQMAQVADQFAG